MSPRRALTLVSVFAVGIGTSACGAGHNTAGAMPKSTAAMTTVDKCKGAKDPRVVRRKLAKLNQEVAHIRVLAAPIQERTLNGTPALSAAVDKFLVDVRDRDLPVHVRSRLIDHVAADVAPVCEQCFQALEANRPIAGGAKLACG
jgi:hypothetical protein